MRRRIAGLPQVRKHRAKRKRRPILANSILSRDRWAVFWVR